jgi:hypothetical protein
MFLYRNLLGRLPANRPVLQQIADVLASLAPPKAEVA